MNIDRLFGDVRMTGMLCPLCLVMPDAWLSWYDRSCEWIQCSLVPWNQATSLIVCSCMVQVSPSHTRQLHAGTTLLSTHPACWCWFKCVSAKQCTTAFTNFYLLHLHKFKIDKVIAPHQVQSDVLKQAAMVYTIMMMKNDECLVTCGTSQRSCVHLKKCV